MHVLVLGGYGLIGEGVCRALQAAGHEVTGFGRSVAKGRAVLPGVTWIAADLRQPQDWARHLDGIDAVVNAAGALQESGRDDLAAVHRDAIAALIAACGDRAFVQISAPGAGAEATTAFLRTKGEADATLRASGLRWTILKPGLVIAPTAYGGTALLRMLAAFPIVQPMLMGGVAVQSVGLDDVARAVVRVLEEPSLAGRDYDLVEPEPRTLAETVLAFRHWLGFSAPARVIEVPGWVGKAVAWAADRAGDLGWRAPLRTTALKVLEDDVRGDPEPWARAAGAPLASLPEVLARIPATRQERQFARTQLVFPLVAGVLAAFWIASGLIGALNLSAAAHVIEDSFAPGVARALVLGGAVLDIAVGVLIARRATFGWGCLASVALALSYLGIGTLTDPWLWADPLGAYVKVFPAIVLSLVALAMGAER